MSEVNECRGEVGFLFSSSPVAEVGRKTVEATLSVGDAVVLDGLHASTLPFFSDCKQHQIQSDILFKASTN